MRVNTRRLLVRSPEGPPFARTIAEGPDHDGRMRSIALDHVPHIHYLLRHSLVRQPALPNVPAVVPILCANGVSAGVRRQRFVK